ncbi:hypothetical protein RGQ29_031923 [Quercus rubra]|uniref:Uncharacterized protein n=1 Tax=Quercus rubra TaxID=3512 RepID=A0AAN7DT98_QUERU|nr:hypothetical protein RGQ29_031923 [Quercus rubra]
MAQGHTIPLLDISKALSNRGLKSCHLFDIPRIVSHGMGVFAMVICKSPSLHVPNFSELKFPFTLNKGDIPVVLVNGDNVRLVVELAEADVNKIEGEYVGALESNYFNKAKSYCVDRFSSMIQLDQELDASYINVIYVSFGTQTHLSNDQMDEIAFGLEMAGHPFIWVVRSKTWAPPDGWTKRVKEEGLVVYDWVEQRRHTSTPFNRWVFESLWLELSVRELGKWGSTFDLPMLDISEQALNAKLVTMGFGAGLVVPTKRCWRLRMRAQELGRLAWHAVEKGGSRKKLDELIERLTIKICDQNLFISLN